MSFLENHKKLERNVTLLLLFSFIAVAIGGIIEIVPLF
jgi:cytochrome c oxidase cbb3-type subunit 2